MGLSGPPQSRSLGVSPPTPFTLSQAAPKGGRVEACPELVEGGRGHCAALSLSKGDSLLLYW
jgi:hypothetical protein